MGVEFRFCKMNNVLELESGDSWPAVWLCLVPLNCMLSCVLRRASHSRLFVTPRTAARQAPPSLGFSRQESWGGLPCPPPGDLPDPGTGPVSLCLPHWQAALYHWKRQPLQRSCLDNPRDGGAWWAAVCGVAQSRTRLNRLSSSTTWEASVEFLKVINKL